MARGGAVWAWAVVVARGLTVVRESCCMLRILVSVVGKVKLEGEGMVRALVEEGLSIRNADV